MSGLVRQIERRNWKALRKQEWIVVDGQDILLRKRGVERLLEDVASIPLFGEMIELLMSKEMLASYKGKPTAKMLQDAFLKAAENAGLDAGRELRRVLTALPAAFKRLFVEDVILADEDERADFADWLGTLGLSGVMDAFVGWAGVNLPEFKAPLVQGAAWLLAEADKLTKGLAAGAVRVPQTSDTAAAPVDTAAAETPAAA